jgi:hypothetical protein
MEMLIESHDERLHEIKVQEEKLKTDCNVWLESLINDFKE